MGPTKTILFNDQHSIILLAKKKKGKGLLQVNRILIYRIRFYDLGSLLNGDKHPDSFLMIKIFF